MRRSMPEGARTPPSRPHGLARSRKVVAILAGACLAFGLLWLVVVLGGPLGPLRVDSAASGFIFFGTVWVVANLIVEAKAKRALPRGPG